MREAQSKTSDWPRAIRVVVLAPSAAETSSRQAFTAMVRHETRLEARAEESECGSKGFDSDSSVARCGNDQKDHPNATKLPTLATKAIAPHAIAWRACNVREKLRAMTSQVEVLFEGNRTSDDTGSSSFP